MQLYMLFRPDVVATYCICNCMQHALHNAASYSYHSYLRCSLLMNVLSVMVKPKIAGERNLTPG